MNEKYQEYYKAVLRYVEDKSPQIFKEAGGRFQHPYIDPGSTTYQGNLWDWDTFWTVYGLVAFSKTDQAPEGFSEKLQEYAKGNVLNFFAFQLEDGYIPMMVDNVNQAPDEEAYLIRKRKEGAVLNMHKPFLAQQSVLVSEFENNYQWLEAYVDNLERYFACYDKDYFQQRSGLYVWADDVMIGMDNDPAVFGRPRFSTASMFLNGFMVSELRAMAKIYQKLGNDTGSNAFHQKADTLVQAIQEECYDPRDQFFYSVDVDIKTRAYDWFHEGLGVFWNTLPIKIRTWTCFTALYAGIATPKQAEELVQLHIKDPSTFCSPYGVRTLARDEKMYNLEATNNPSNWLGPIWTVANYVTFRGLLNYGYKEEATELCRRILRLLGEDLERTGELHEYYVPETGHPVMTPGFLNWNMLAVNMVQELAEEFSVFDFFSL